MKGRPLSSKGLPKTLYAQRFSMSAFLNMSLFLIVGLILGTGTS